MKKMLINATHPEENRVAIVEDGLLTELDIEISGKEQTRGNIYKGTVVRVETGLQAAFVDFGSERLGFLQMGELHPKYFEAAAANPEIKGRPRITDILHRGQEILVQIVKEERGTKGAALTTHISLPGRYMVMMPESNTRGVSRKIESEGQRKKLREQMDSMNLPENMGYIIRTAALDQESSELKRDFDYLVRLFENIVALGAKIKAPALIFKESNLVIRSIRDYFSEDMEEVLVDDPRVFREARDFFNMIMPEFARLVKLHQEKRPIFSRYQIEEQIETIFQNKISLPSGGSIVIDSTEALVAVDVNSGKMASEQGVEATATKTNLEAAAEVARQLRLRDLGGLIVIDFIDMRDRKHIKEVERCLKNALKSDKARVTVGHISQFGLLEMSRQRIRQTLAEGSYQTCPHCHGRGKIKSVEAQSVALLRKIQAGLAKGSIGRVEGDIPLEVANYLLNNRRRELHSLEHQHNVDIHIRGLTDLKAGEMELNFLKKEKEEKAQDFVDASLAVLQQVSAEVAEEAAAAEAPVEAVAEDLEQQPAATEGVPKKRSRNRRRKKREDSAQPGEGTSETQPDAAVSADAAEGPASLPADEVSPAAEAAPATASGDTSATQPAPAGESVESTPSTPDQATEAPPAASSTETTGEAAAAEKPVKPASRSRRRRSGRSKTAAANQEKTASAATDSEAPQATETVAPQTEELKVPTPSTPPAEKEPAQPSAEPVSEGGTEEKPAAPKKPARKRRPRATAKNKEAATTPETTAVNDPAAESKPSEAGKTEASTSVPSPEPAAEGTPATAAAASGAEEQKDSEVKKPARKRTRRTTKKPADKAEAAPVSEQKAQPVEKVTPGQEKSAAVAAPEAAAQKPAKQEQPSSTTEAKGVTKDGSAKTAEGPADAEKIPAEPKAPAKRRPGRPRKPRAAKPAEKESAPADKPAAPENKEE